MSIEELDKIDFISSNAASGEEELTISDHLDWGTPERHLELLQQKVYRYLDFVDSGEIYQQRPGARGRRIVIRIRAAHQAPLAATALIEKLRGVTLSEGVELEFHGPIGA